MLEDGKDWPGGIEGQDLEMAGVKPVYEVFKFYNTRFCSIVLLAN